MKMILNFLPKLLTISSLTQAKIVSIKKANQLITTPKPTCDPPNNQDVGLTWFGQPLSSPYVYYTAPAIQRSWHDAAAFCNALGVNQTIGINTNTAKINLARIMTEFENEAVLETVKMFNSAARKNWIAGNLFTDTASNSSEWRWVQTSYNNSETLLLPLNYTNWGSNQPADDKNTQDSMAFVSKAFSNLNPGEWFSRSSENDQYFICEFRCEENPSKELLFSSGSHWITTNSDYRYSYVGDVNLPENFQVSCEFELTQEGSLVIPLTVGAYGNSYSRPGKNVNKLPTLPNVYWTAGWMIISLSGTVAKEECSFTYTFTESMDTYTAYQISFNFLSDKIEIFYENLLLSTCQPLVDNEIVFSCELATGEGSYDSVNKVSLSVGFCNDDGFQYEAKPWGKLPVYAGLDDDWGYSRPGTGKVRNINIYSLL